MYADGRTDGRMHTLSISSHFIVISYLFSFGSCHRKARRRKKILAESTRSETEVNIDVSPWMFLYK